MNSQIFKLDWKDIGKGVLIAFLTVVLGGVYTSLQAGAFPTLAQLGSLAMAGLAAGLSYLLKNFFTNSDNQLAKPESPAPPAK